MPIPYFELLRRFWPVAAIGISLLLAGYGGWTLRDWRCDAQIAAIQRELQEARDKQAKQADEASSGAEIAREAQDARSIETRTVIRETFREIPVPAECAAPVAVADSLRASVDTANASLARQP